MGSEVPIVLDRGSRTPLANQLAERLRQAIHDGALASDVSLPSTRRLAAELGISRGVVVRAFEQLAGEGYLEPRGAAGTRVAVRPDVRRRRPPHAAPVDQEAAALVIDLTPGRPSGRPFRDREWRAAWRRAAETASETSLPPAEGIDVLRTAIASRLGVARGSAAVPGQVIVTAGTSDALQLVANALRGRSHTPRVLVEDPGYPTARRVLAAAGVSVETVPVGPDGLVAEGLPTRSAVPDAVLVTPSHQYPLGGHMPIQARLGLLAWAAQHGVVVLEDDYDSEFRHRRSPLPTLASLQSEAEVLLIGTFSKTLSPSLRCGYLVSDGRSFGRRVSEARRLLDPPVAAPLQAALAYYIQSGGLGRHIARARREYTHRRELLITRLGRRDDVSLGALDGGLHAVINLSAGVDAHELTRRALASGVCVVPLSTYYANRTPENGLVIGYGATTDLELTRALDILCELLDDFRSTDLRPERCLQG